MSTLEKVIAIVSRETGEDVNADTRLDSLGLDSLEFVCLIQAIQSEVVDVPEEEFVNINTPEEIVKVCEHYLNV